MAVKCCVRCLEASWCRERVDKLVWRGRKLSCVCRVCWSGCGVAPFCWLMDKIEPLQLPVLSARSGGEALPSPGLR